jgi:predicted NUDIX family NTP pyrophosphohydrolase
MRNDAASSPRLPAVKCSRQECHDHYTEAVSPISAGILLFRRRSSRTEVFLVHPGGPYWAQKESGAWSVPKGLIIPGEEDLECARREFKEETGFDLHGTGNEHDLGIFRQPSGKRLHVWAVEGDCNPSNLTSNLFEMEWPPKSGHKQQFPEVDRGGWFDREQAVAKITKGQRPILESFYTEIG